MAELVVGLAGAAAQERAAPASSVDVGMTDDLKRVTETLDLMQFDPNEAAELVVLYARMAREDVDKDWNQIRFVAEALLRRGSIKGPELERLIEVADIRERMRRRAQPVVA